MKQYKRWSTIAGFDNLDKLRDGRILKFLDIILRDSLRTKHEATQRRLRLFRDLTEHAEDGMIAIVTSGRDCDGVQYSGDWSIIEATAKAVDAEVNSIYKWADGPIFSIALEKPSVAKGIERESRDLTMEAHENGHPWVLRP